MGLAPYISYSESFLPTTGTDFFGNPFAPTTGQQYETGLKFEPLGSRSRLTLALFDITQQNVLTPDPTPGRIGFNIQTGEIRSRGFEAEVVTNVVEGFNLIATYTKLDVEVTKSTTTETIGKAPSSPRKSSHRSLRTTPSRRARWPALASAPARAMSAKATWTTST